MDMSPPPVMGSLQIKWDPKNLEIRTKTVEKTLEPLVTQVTTLVNQKGPSNKKKGRSKKGHVLAAAVQKATENFIISGEDIANENPDVKQDMLAAVDEVRKTGETMRSASEEFAADPCSSMKRGAMVRAARALLSAVTRLLILADMVDVHLLLKSLRVVENDLDRIRNASSHQELMDSFKEFGKSVVELSERAAQRQADLKDPRRRDDLAASRATLKKSSMMLLTASKAYVRHPELAAAKANRDWAYEQLCNAVNTISGVAQATGPSSAHPYEGAGELAAALDELMQKVIMDPLTYNEVRTRPSLEERLESIISGAALMADSACTRDDRRERIVMECNAVRQALQDLLTEYMNNAGQSEPSEELDRAIDNMMKKTKDLRRQLRKAVVDHVSDSFLETNVPLLVLIEAAKAGDEKGVEEYAVVFADHANKLVEVANLACSMSSNEEGVKMVRMAATDLETLCPQVINAARVLAARPRSKVTLENMDAFKDAWETQVRLLTDAVDDITTVDSLTPSNVINAARVLAARPRSKVTLENMDAFKDAWETQVRLLTDAVDDITTTDFLTPSNVINAARVLSARPRSKVTLENMDAFKDAWETQVRLLTDAVDDITTIDFFTPSNVINAARVLAARPRSKVTLENMDAFKDAWETQVRLLTDAVDDITTIDDFLAVSESHILEDVNKCVFALQEGDADTLDRTAGAIRGRSARVCNVVSAEMDNYEPGSYTDRVMEAVVLLRDQVMPNFAEKVELAVDALSQNMPERVDENEFIDASRLVYDGVRDIRQAVLMNRAPEELDTDTDLEDEADHYDTRSRSSYQTDVDDMQGKSDRALMRELPEEEKEKIQAQFEMFRQEKAKLDMEVAKWDDSGNDIIVIAKQMCMIMMEMTDFTRGRGPLKSTMDVIGAAKKISEAGTKLDTLANVIAEQCPDSSSKKDLVAYLQRIALYCHQLNITSKVKADVQSVGGELIVSGLDSATSLITAAKNLMNSVVLTVKACYVASTKYKVQSGKSRIVTWKMKPPEKKPLVRRDEGRLGRISKSAARKKIEPIKALNEFQEIGPDSFC